MIKPLREIIKAAEEKKVAVGHFNISNMEGVWAVFRAAQKLNVPVIIGASEGERDFVGVRAIAAVVKSIREEFDFPVYLNADHTYSFERVKEAIDAGFDAAIIDGAKLPIDENLTMTKKCVEYAKSSGKDVLIEAEIGFIGQSSKILDAIPEGVGLSGDALTKPEVAADFVKKTGINLLAPSVGNFHGMVKDPSVQKKIDAKRVADIRAAAGVPLVLHGGSGTSDAEFTEAIHHGISIVHINTELRVAYRKGLTLSLQENPEEIAPYKYLKAPLQAMQKVVEEKLRLFNHLS